MTAQSIPAATTAPAPGATALPAGQAKAVNLDRCFSCRKPGERQGFVRTPDRMKAAP